MKNINIVLFFFLETTMSGCFGFGSNLKVKTEPEWIETKNIEYEPKDKSKVSSQPLIEPPSIIQSNNEKKITITPPNTKNIESDVEERDDKFKKANNERDMSDRMKQLKKIYEQGFIDKREYETKRKELIDSL